MTIADDRAIEVSVSGRLNALTFPWEYVRRHYVRQFFGEAAVKEAEKDLIVNGKWNGRCHGGTLYLKLTPNAIGQGSAACGASPAPTGCAAGGEE